MDSGSYQPSQGTNSQPPHFHNDITQQYDAAQPPSSAGQTVGQHPQSHTQPPYPGQFAYPPQPPRRRRSFGQWYKAQKRSAKIGLGCASLLLVVMLCICSMVAFASMLPPPAKTAQTTQTIPTGTSTAATLGQQNQTATPTLALAKTPTPTATPLPTATPSPTPLPTPRPTSPPTPRPTQPPPPLSIAFTCASAVDYSYGHVCVHTLAGAALTITVTYCSGYDASSASLQGTVYANSSGNYTWSWTPETKCRGTATASVTANGNGQSTSHTDTFTVQ